MKSQEYQGKSCHAHALEVSHSSALLRSAIGAQSDEEIEDWELWADPREIERRKAERARARVPPEERRKQVSICMCSRG